MRPTPGRLPEPVDLVVFDLGEVLSDRPPHLDSLAQLLRADPAAFAAAYWGERDPYDRGAVAADYWAAVAAAVGRPVDAATVDALTRVDASAWTTLHPDSWPLLRDLSAAGVRLALLSNAPTPLADAVRAEPWARLLDPLVFSCDLRATKPDPISYAAVVAGAGVDPGRTLFFDDRPVNVEGARRVGWQAHLWAGHDDARARLASAGVLG